MRGVNKANALTKKKKRKEPRNESINEINGKVYSQLGLKKDVLSTTIDLKVGNTKQAIIASILGLWQHFAKIGEKHVRT